MCGNGSYINTDTANTLNLVAQEIFDHRDGVLDPVEIETLRQIIMICNVIYNRTDLNVQLVEDGFYDLLLELYKRYDSNFQVGSAIVEFQNIIDNDIDNPLKVATCPITFHQEDESRDEIHQFVRDELMSVPKPTREDLVSCPITFNTPPVSKRVHDTYHNHPQLVGTLDKCKFIFVKEAIDAGVYDDPTVKILERDFFQKHINEGIISLDEELEIVCELKYDGISVEADCTNRVISARTRGDTGIGKASDITPILQDYPFRHAQFMQGRAPIGVKFEAIITKSDLYRFNNLREKSYVNCRSAIVGIMGSGDGSFYRDYITLVPLAVDRDNVPEIKNRIDEIEFMNTLFRSNGEPLRYCYFTGTVTEILFLIKAFHDEAIVARDRLDFMYDGIVVSYVDEQIREKLGRVNNINKYSMAVKFQPLTKQTIFNGYTYEVGQHGDITPMIHYNPVEFFGTIHTKSSGSSLARFQELNLKVGDYIDVTYRNDVMPYVSRLECDHNRNNTNPQIEFPKVCPCCGTELVISDTGKTAYCPNMGCRERCVSRMTNTFAKLNIKGFARASVEALGINHLYEIQQLNDLEICKSKLGEADGTKFYSIIQSILNDTWLDYMVIGSIGFKGIAHKKWKDILEKVDIEQIYDHYKNDSHFRFWLIDKLGAMKESTIDTIYNEFPFFEKDVEFIVYFMHLRRTNIAEDALQIRFSGVRSPELCAILQDNGIDADDGSVTKRTNVLIVPFAGYDSINVRKAEKYGAKIAVLGEFIEDVNYYIGKDIDISSIVKAN